MRIAIFTIVSLALWGPSGQAAAPVDWMVKLTLHGEQIEGTPLAWDARRVHLLGRDGRLWQFDPDQAVDFRKTSDRFRSCTVSELRAELLRELGPGFEVSGTTHYLVAHRRGQRDRWAPRFEELYRSFVHYFTVRGFKLSTPPFPLIGIVCQHQRDFERFTAKQGATAPAGLLGFYAPGSNRITLYELGGKEDAESWQQNAAVIIHEATHQTAFNTGVHSRYAAAPLWVVEGLATMFEAPGVYDSRYHTRRSDRINQGRLRDFQKSVAPNHRPEFLASIIASDRLFYVNPPAAYAEAWALSFYLVETQPREYAEYLVLTARRPPFSEYTAAERTADFRTVFGDDWRMLQARFLRFMAGVN